MPTTRYTDVETAVDASSVPLRGDFDVVDLAEILRRAVPGRRGKATGLSPGLRDRRQDCRLR
jgi:hypothetical protein